MLTTQSDPMSIHRRIFLFCILVALVACQRKPAPKAKASQDRNLPITEVSVTDPDVQSRLRGFYEGTVGWKWTGKDFAVSLDAPEWHQQTFLDLDFTVPGELLAQAKTVTLTAKINGVEVGTGTFAKEGRYTFGRLVPDKALQKTPLEIAFSIDKIAHFADGRAMGVIVVSVSLRPSEEEIVDRDLQVRMAREGYQKLLAERNRKMSPEKQQELMRLFHDIPVWEHMWFHNVQIAKNPLDLWMMQDILYQVQPDFVIETGTWRGGSALYWAHTLNGMGLEHSRVITVDIQDFTRTAAEHPLWKKYVTFIRGSSTDPNTVARIAKLAQGHKVVVTLDSDHSMKHVLNELHAYAPMVSSRSYLIVEDTHIDGVPTQPDAGPGPFLRFRSFWPKTPARTSSRTFRAKRSS